MSLEEWLIGSSKSFRTPALTIFNLKMQISTFLCNFFLAVSRTINVYCHVFSKTGHGKTTGMKGTWRGRGATGKRQLQQEESWREMTIQCKYMQGFYGESKQEKYFICRDVEGRFQIYVYGLFCGHIAKVRYVAPPIPQMWSNIKTDDVQEGNWHNEAYGRKQNSL